MNNLLSKFGKFVPNTPAKALLWFNFILLILSPFMKPLTIDMITISIIGILCSYYLWILERAYDQVTQIQVMHGTTINYMGHYFSSIRHTLLVYGALIILYLLLRNHILSILSNYIF